MKMYNPPHPGEVLREDVLSPLDITVNEMANRLGVSRVTISRIIHEHASISTDLARRLELAGVSTARQWLAVQMAYDLWKLEQTNPPEVKSLMA